MSEPWAYVAHKDGKFGGACVASISKKSLHEFLQEFAADGFTLQPVSDRAEYLTLTEAMPVWHGEGSRP